MGSFTWVEKLNNSGFDYSQETAIAVTIALLLSLYLLRQFYLSAQDLAPGPLRLPLIGNFLSAIPLFIQYTGEPWKAMQAMSKRYGDFLSLSAGSINFIILSSCEVMQDLLVRDEWSAKMNYSIFQQRSTSKAPGILFVENQTIWMEMRKFSLRTLRDFGFGKRQSMQEIIEMEISVGISAVTKNLPESNGILRIDNNFGLSVINIFWAMVAGKTYPHDDPRLLAMLELTTRGSKLFSLMNPRLIFPTLDKWMGKITNHIGLKKFGREYFDELNSIIQPIIDSRRAEGTYLTEPENFVDAFLQKIERNRGKPDTVYTEEQLLIMIQDFWLVGSVTTSSTISYGIFFLVLNPEAQRRVQAEIDDRVLAHAIPTVEDIEKMPYTQATILEIHRLASVVPLPIPRVIQHETYYRGYRVPEGTCVVSNHWAVHMDRDYWGDPEVFRPERFINENGEFVPDKHVLHFGVGKRYCIGVSFVNSVLPIFITTLFQKFSMSLVPGQDSPILMPSVGMTLAPYPFNVRIKPRHAEKRT